MLRNIANRLLQVGFCNSKPLVDRHGLKKFLQGDIPQSLKYDRPFSKLHN
jgi:hypothetical protein